MTRRDALKRLAGLVGSMAIASSLLAACAPAATPTAAPAKPTAAGPAPTAAPTVPPKPAAGPAPTAAPTVPPKPTAEPPAKPAAAASPAASPAAKRAAATPVVPAGLRVPENDPAIEASMVEFPGQAGTVLAYFARPKGSGPFPAVLICHENRGLVEHTKDVTRRFAKAGYVGLAVDLLSRQGGTGKVTDPAQVPGLLGNMPVDQAVQDFQAGVRYLQGQPFVSRERLGMTGFCFGGGITWRVTTKTPELKAAVPFYGPIPPVEEVPGIRAAVLAMYGETDQRITSGAATIEAAMKQNNKTFEKIVYPGAGHAFFNDTGQAYNPAAATDAWTKMLAWFEKYLK